MRGGTTLPSAPEAHRLAQQRNDRAKADAQRLLAALTNAIRRAVQAGWMELVYDVPTILHAPVDGVLRELEALLRTKGYRTERVVGRPRSLRIRWDGVSGGLFFLAGYT